PVSAEVQPRARAVGRPFPDEPSLLPRLALNGQADNAKALKASDELSTVSCLLSTRSCLLRPKRILFSPQRFRRPKNLLQQDRLAHSVPRCQQCSQGA